MRRILFATAAVAFGSRFAPGADIRAPVNKAPVMAPVENWTGFYLGLNAGINRKF